MKIINKIKDLKNLVKGSQPRSQDWSRIIKAELDLWSTAKRSSGKRTRVLIATSLGGYDGGALLESTLAAALTLRGADVDILLCDAALQACQMSKLGRVAPKILAEDGMKDYCSKCFANGKAIFEPLGLPIYTYSEFLSAEDRKIAQQISTSIPYEDIPAKMFEGFAVGEHSYAGALRYFARGDLKAERHAEDILRKYLESAILTIRVTQAIIDKNNYDVVVFHHGIYVPQGLIGEVCRKRNLRVVNSNPAYRKQTFIFSHGDTYHRTMISEPVETWLGIELDLYKQRRINDYLKSRWSGTNDWIWFHERPIHDISAIKNELGIDFQKPTIGLLTSVMWDAQLHYRSNAFKNMLEWIFVTINYFRSRQDLQLLIRIHPAEVNGMIPSRQTVIQEIQNNIAVIPSNVFIILPESSIGTYSAMEKCDAVLIYNTKTGIELAAMGIPVIVAGEAWIRNKGFSYDVSSEKEYIEALEKLPFGQRLDDTVKHRAMQYAYHFFYRRMIDFPFIKSGKKFDFSLSINKLSDLKDGAHNGLDCICKGILEGSAFTLMD